jgi:hypothetical protein
MIRSKSARMSDNSNVYVQVFSDFHFLRTYPYRFAHKADILILAGDIIANSTPISGNVFDRFLRYVNVTWKDTILVLGNHELYNFEGTFGETIKRYAKQISKYRNIHLLEQSAITIRGIRFIGGIYWRPGELAHNNDKIKFTMQRDETMESVIHRPTVKFIMREIATQSNLFVVTHFPPFECDDDLDIIVHDHLTDNNFSHPCVPWVYGHTHRHVTVTCNRFKMICNQSRTFPRGPDNGYTHDGLFRVRFGAVKIYPPPPDQKYQPPTRRIVGIDRIS